MLSRKNNFIEVTEFYHSTIWIDNGILFGKYKPELIITLEVAIAIVRDRMKISNGIIRPFLIDITEMTAVNKEGRKYLASKEACELVSAGAIYTNHPLMKIVGNAFILLDRPRIPIKLFTNQQAALRWL